MRLSTGLAESTALHWGGDLWMSVPCAERFRIAQLVQGGDFSYRNGERLPKLPGGLVAPWRVFRGRGKRPLESKSRDGIPEVGCSEKPLRDCAKSLSSAPPSDVLPGGQCASAGCKIPPEAVWPGTAAPPECLGMRKLPCPANGVVCNTVLGAALMLWGWSGDPSPLALLNRFATSGDSLPVNVGVAGPESPAL